MQWFREWEAFVKGKDNGKDQTLGSVGGRGGMEMSPFAGSWLSTAPGWGDKAGQGSGTSHWGCLQVPRAGQT